MTAPLHLVTGEYPPQRGGVADYTAAVASALHAQGREVHVWAPETSAGEGAPRGVTVHRLPGVFDRGALQALDDALGTMPSPRHLIVQYVPQSFGRRGMNVGFCRWVRRRAEAHHDDVRVMFHEAFYPFEAWPPHRNLLALVNRWMAHELMAGARVAYVSAESWARRLRPYAPRGLAFTWLPIPSTIPRVDDAAAVDAARRAAIGDARDAVLIGHFGTYGALVAPLVAEAARRLLDAHATVHFLFMGDGSDRLAAALRAQLPAHAQRISATGRQAPERVSVSLQACDLVVQPYKDGASGRRTTLMAALANGVAVVSNRGAATERVWGEQRALALADSAAASALAATAESLLTSEAARRALGAAGRTLYDACFSMSRTVQALMDGGEGRA
jgi:glycosyltransferase involved in cell wall biosynthesis